MPYEISGRGWVATFQAVSMDNGSFFDDLRPECGGDLLFWYRFPQLVFCCRGSRTARKIPLSHGLEDFHRPALFEIRGLHLAQSCCVVQHVCQWMAHMHSRNTHEKLPFSSFTPAQMSDSATLPFPSGGISKC